MTPGTHQRLLPLLVLVALASAGCTTTDASHILVGERTPAIDPAEVRLYAVEPDTFDSVALLRAEATNDFAGQQELLDRAVAALKRQAAQLGANGIVVNDTQEQSDRDVGHLRSESGTLVVRTGRKMVVEGLAIRVDSPPAD